MQNFTTMGSMEIRLLRFIDNAEIHDSNYDIATILLKNIDRVRNMTIKEVSELCYVSQASISRFCRTMGFGSFKDFHAMISTEFSLRDDYSRNYISALKKDPNQARETYTQLILSNIESVMDPENLKDLDSITRLIHDCPSVSVFSHHFLYDIGAYLQFKLVTTGKYIHAYQIYDKQLQDAGELTKDDAAIIYTIGGTYCSRYPEIWETINASQCKLIFITQNLSNPYLNNAAYVLQCGNTNKENTGKYAALALTDCLIQNYYRKYGENNI